jgi:hypothetical protein
MAFPFFVAFISWPKQTSYDDRNANVLDAAMLLCGAAFQALPNGIGDRLPFGSRELEKTGYILGFADSIKSRN